MSRRAGRNVEDEDDSPRLMVAPSLLRLVLWVIYCLALVVPLGMALTVWRPPASHDALSDIATLVLVVLLCYVEYRVLPVWHAFGSLGLAIVAAAGVVLTSSAAVASRAMPVHVEGAVFLAGEIVVLAVVIGLIHRAPRVRLPLANPLRDATWYACHAGGRITNAHAVSRSQRYAVDAVVIVNGRRATGVLPAQLEHYFSYGATVFSPVDGTVVEDRSTRPDLAPCLADAARPYGNYVGVRTGDGDTVYLAHLRTGSVRVRSGDVVRAGDPIASVGNSGNTSEPHLHVHVERDDESPVPFTVGGRWLLRASIVRAKSR